MGTSLGTVTSKHAAEYDTVRFNEALNYLKEFDSSEMNTISDEEELNTLIQKYYDKESDDLIEDDHVKIDLFASHQEKLIDAACYYLTHYKSSPVDLPRCINTECQWNAADSKKQVHLILYHSSRYVLQTYYIFYACFSPICLSIFCPHFKIPTTLHCPCYVYNV